MKFLKKIGTFFVVAALIMPCARVFAAEMTEKYVICIDAGHGGRDGGTDAGTHMEKEYNLKIAECLRDALVEDERFDVVMTRDDDTYLKYLNRAEIAREANADLLLSVHCNQVPEEYISGTQAYVSLIPEYSATEIAKRLLDAVETSVGIPVGRIGGREDSGDSLGVYYWNSERQWDMPGAKEYGQISDYYSMNTWSSKFGIPSVIIEHGYLSNAHDLAVLNDDALLEKMAKAEADAIITYFTDHTHDFVKVVDYPSNCVFSGRESQRCTVCGAKTDTEELPPDTDAHFWRLLSTDADGEEHYICQIEYNLDAKGMELGHPVTELTGAEISEAEQAKQYDEPLDEPLDEPPPVKQEPVDPVEPTETEKPTDETKEKTGLIGDVLESVRKNPTIPIITAVALSIAVTVAIVLISNGIERRKKRKRLRDEEYEWSQKR